MDLMQKLTILADSAKYDVACTSSGVNRGGAHGSIGSASAPGICHTFSADGRCVSLLKVLMTNVCTFDCAYCVNRRSNDVPRAAFTPQELADFNHSILSPKLHRRIIFIQCRTRQSGLHNQIDISH